MDLSTECCWFACLWTNALVQFLWGGMKNEQRDCFLLEGLFHVFNCLCFNQKAYISIYPRQNYSVRGEFYQGLSSWNVLIFGTILVMPWIFSVPTSSMLSMFFGLFNDLCSFLNICSEIWNINAFCHCKMLNLLNCLHILRYTHRKSKRCGITPSLFKLK